MSAIAFDGELSKTAQRSIPVQRITWLDAAKGIGIVLVVIGHALGGINDSSLQFGDGPIRQIFLAIYIVHMPLMFLLSGVLVQPRLKKGSANFVRSLSGSLVFPYFLWGAVQIGMILLLGSLVNHPIAPIAVLWDILSLPVQPPSQFWFLYALGIMHLSAMLLVRLGTPFQFLVLAFLVRGVAEFFVMPDFLTATARLIPFYAIGVLLGTEGIARQIERVRSSSAFLILSGFGVAALIITVYAMMREIGMAAFLSNEPRLASADIGLRAWEIDGFVAALLMSATIIGLADRLRGRALTVFSWLGRMSFPIFVLHILCLAGLRIVLTKLLRIYDVSVILPSIIAAGLAGPLVIYAIIDRLHLKRAVGFA